MVMNQKKLRFIKFIRNYFFIASALIAACPNMLCAQNDKTLNFIHLTMNEGLSNNMIQMIFQDSRNFIWFGTEDGLNRFDGYNFIVYRNDKMNPNSLSDNYITSITEDSEGFLWIGTGSGGLNKYDRKTDQFVSYVYNDKNPNSIADNFVRKVYEDRHKQLWIGTANGGLDLFDRKKGIFIHHKPDLKTNTAICSNSVGAIYEDRKGRLWIGSRVKGLDLYDHKTNTFKHFACPFGEGSQNINGIFEDSDQNLWIATIDGLVLFNKETEDFKIFRHDPNNPYSLSNSNINPTIVEDNNKNLWIGTSDGLNLLDKKTMKFYHWQNDRSNPQSLSSNNTMSLFIDKQGILWVGTTTTGVDKNAYKNIGFKNYIHDPNTPGSLPKNTVRSLFVDRDDNVWVGTIGGGLNKWDKANKKFIQYKHKPEDPSSISSDEVTSIGQDHDGNIWIGCWAGGGLNMLSPKGDKFVHFMHDKRDPNSFIEESNIVQKVFEDSFGRLWISSNGVDRFDKQKKTFIHHLSDPKNPKSLGNNWTQSAMLEDKEGNIWIGCWGGLSKLVSPKITGKDPMDDKEYVFENYSHNPEDPNSLSDNRIISLGLGDDGTLWIGTYGGGLDKMIYDIDPKTKAKKARFINYTVKDGLPNDVVFGVLVDKKGFVWIATNNGLSKFDPKNKTFRNFHTENGLQSNQFFWGASYKSESGALYFGGVNGFNSFYPDSLFEDHFVPPVVITDFKIFNQTVEVGPNSRFPTHISECKTLELSYKDEIISFEFSSLDYNAPEKNRYAYMLEGFNKEWVQIDAKHRYITFMNLEPGHYTFKLKGTNSDGIWNPKITTLEIIIKPPFWKTWWFRFASIILILSITISFYRFRINQIKAQKRDLEIQVEARTLEIRAKNEELAQQAEQLALSNHELEKLSLVASHTDNAVIIMDGTGTLEWVNDGFTRLYEHTLESFKISKGSNLLDYNYSDDIKLAITNCLSNKHSVVYEDQIDTASGKHLWIQTVLTPIVDESGEVFKLVAIDSDITNIKKAEKEIFQQNEKISGSIRYAKTIQQAILTFKDNFEDIFHSFIIYKPKDIVSGDFYWFTKIAATDTEPEKVIIAVADCTGHGVPGAFMSMVGSRLISEVVLQRSIHSPRLILDALYKDIRIILRQDQTKNSDGMDIGICLLEPTSEGMQLTFSGAKSGLFYFDGMDKEIKILKSDKISIGGFNTKREFKGFTEIDIQLKHGAQFYLMSDGIIDQNDNQRIRFGTKRMAELLTKVSEYNCEDQKKILEESIRDFQKNESQRDDMTLIGIKLC